MLISSLTTGVVVMPCCLKNNGELCDSTKKRLAFAAALEGQNLFILGGGSSFPKMAEHLQHIRNDVTIICIDKGGDPVTDAEEILKFAQKRYQRLYVVSSAFHLNAIEDIWSYHLKEYKMVQATFMPLPESADLPCTLSKFHFTFLKYVGKIARYLSRFDMYTSWVRANMAK